MPTKFSRKNNQPPKFSRKISLFDKQGKYVGKCPWGGFIPNPPDYCPSKGKTVVGGDGVKWLDSCICMRVCSTRTGGKKGDYSLSFCDYARNYGK